MATAPAVHPGLGRLTDLIGEWEGEGRGVAPSGAAFAYRERLRFDHNGKPLLIYLQRTAALDDGRPLHGESGYWRVGPAGDVELVLAHSIGIVEVEEGRWHDGTLSLVTTVIQGSTSAKRVTALERDFELEPGRLRYSLRMAMEGGTPRFHLSADLTRV